MSEIWWKSCVWKYCKVGGPVSFKSPEKDQVDNFAFTCDSHLLVGTGDLFDVQQLLLGLLEVGHHLPPPQRVRPSDDNDAKMFQVKSGWVWVDSQHDRLSDRSLVFREASSKDATLYTLAALILK